MLLFSLCMLHAGGGRRHGLHCDLDRAKKKALSYSVFVFHRSSPGRGVRVEHSRADSALNVCDLERPGAGRNGRYPKQAQPILSGFIMKNKGAADFSRCNTMYI